MTFSYILVAGFNLEEQDLYSLFGQFVLVFFPFVSLALLILAPDLRKNVIKFILWRLLAEKRVQLLCNILMYVWLLCTIFPPSN